MATLDNVEYTRTGTDGVTRTLVAHSPADQVRLEFNGWVRRVAEPAAAPLQAPHPPPPDPQDSPDEAPASEEPPAEGDDAAAQVQAPSRRR